MPSPVGKRHYITSANAAGWLWTNRSRTPGIELGDHGSTALTNLCKVQPDAFLRILPDHGGQTVDHSRIIAGAPELIVEVADRSKNLDLGPKLIEYGRAGALEYIVFTIDPDEVFWHLRIGVHLVRIVAGPDGFYRSTFFPGLWLDPTAFMADDSQAILAVLEQCLTSLEHADFVKTLEGRKR